MATPAQWLSLSTILPMPVMKWLSSLVQNIPKHNILIIGGDMNAQISKDENNKFSLHKLPNRNSEYLTAFSLKNSLSCLNTKF